jgi:estrogen-related receptor beta like 1
LGNSGEQFYTFSCLSAWLIKSKGGFKNSSLNPQEHEDPNVTITSILDVIRSETDYKIEFPPSKLKQGFGLEVIWTLNVLADQALKYCSTRNNDHNNSRSKGNNILSIVIKGLSGHESETPLDEDEETASNEDDDLEINFDDTLFEDEDVPESHTSLPSSKFIDATKNMSLASFIPSSVTQNRDVLTSNTDESSWKKEVERVLPQLKVVVRSSDVKNDWRLRLSQFRSSKEEMDKEMEMSVQKLGRLMKDISSNMEKVVSREEYLQHQFEPILSEYIGLRSQRNAVLSDYERASSGITDKSAVLSSISDELESLKTEMEERGSSMTDGTPLVSLRKALQRIKNEVTTIDVRIGVATHTILQANLKDSLLQNYIERGRGGHEDPEDPHKHLF